MKSLPIRFNWNAVSRSFPLHTYMFYYLSIHSPNHLPDLDGRQEFKMINIREVTTIKFSELRIERLGNGFDTDCYSFETENNYSYYRMRSDCLNDCYQDKLRDICKVESGYFMSNYLLKLDYITNPNDQLISCRDSDYNSMNLKIELVCVQICKVECKFNYYSLEIERTKNGPPALFIRHNEYPDVHVKHVPEITLMGFICSFGGLLGMWLGLSFFAIFNNIFYLVNQFVTKNINLNLHFKVKKQSNNKHGHLRPITNRW